MSASANRARQTVIVMNLNTHRRELEADTVKSVSSRPALRSREIISIEKKTANMVVGIHTSHISTSRSERVASVFTAITQTRIKWAVAATRNNNALKPKTTRSVIHIYSKRTEALMRGRFSCAALMLLLAEFGGGSHTRLPAWVRRFRRVCSPFRRLRTARECPGLRRPAR